MNCPTEEQLSRRVPARVQLDDYLSFFGLSRYDKERLQMLFWAAIPTSADGIVELERMNRMAVRFRNAGLKGEALLERMADSIVRRWA